MAKLLFVDRGETRHPMFFRGRDLFPEPRVLQHDGVDPERNRSFEKQASIFFCEDNQVDLLMEELAQQNPGCEVSVYECVGSGICPAGDFVKKRVTADGVLPA